MQLRDALAQGIALLEKGSIPSPRLTAEVLLMHAARCDRAHLYAHPERELTDAETNEYRRYLDERLRGKPTQYITGHQEFWSMDFLVNPSVLIPRPETEVVVEAALEVARRCFSHRELKLADVGTGSGCIAVALASELPRARIYALDNSPAALETARRNAERLGVGERIEFLLSDLLRVRVGQDGNISSGPLPFGRGSDLDMVVSNPPYVAYSEDVQREVREFEPRAALFAGESGTEVYGRLIPQAAEVLVPGGYLVLELGYDCERRVRKLLEAPEWDEVRWLPDLAGITRVVTARRTPFRR